VLVTGGATAQPLDDMRIITNRSSGRTAVEIARAAFMAGYDTTLFLGHATVDAPGYIDVRRFTTVNDLIGLIDSTGGWDAVIHAAAVSDYSPERSEGKIRSGKDELVIKLKPTRKVIGIMRERWPSARIYGFKAEPYSDKDRLVQAGRELMEKYGIDGVFANPISVASSERMESYLITPGGVAAFSGPKEEFGSWVVGVVFSER
jgi:phosphopantothenoylcysteine decarboxylase/phosphopantothenate--cysteine ligase